MNTKQKRIVIGVLVALVIITLLAVLAYSQRVPMNPDGTVGNTAGNINNSGLFCEYDGKVYFSNSYDGGSLFVMNPDETELRRLNYLKVQNILAGGKYLYYFQTGSTSSSTLGQIPGMTSFERCKLNGKSAASLTRDVVTSAQLVNNYLYMLAATNAGPSFYKIKIDKSDKTELANVAINPACAQDGVIYYNGVESDHYLYALRTSNDSISEVWAGNLWYPILDGNYVYYMDVENNYRLCRYSVYQNVVEVLTNDRVDCFNVGNGYIYYQKNSSDPQLICMRTDGTGAMTIAYGTFTNINMTSQYVYFQAFDDNTNIYHAYIGSSTYSSFTAAAEAAASK